jgi:hypothetical protein
LLLRGESLSPQRRTSVDLVSLVVMEKGSEWPGHVGGSDDLVAVGADERLLDRTRRRLELLQGRGQRVRVAVLACSEATDLESTDRRAEVARELLAAVATDPFGRIVLSSPRHPSLRLRRELLCLVGALSDRVKGTAVTVSVRFDREVS